MNSINVAFAVDDVIAEKLKHLSGTEGQDFILGKVENDDFERHFKGIEEFDEYWEKVITFLRKKSVDLLGHGRNLEESNHDNLLILMESSYMREVLEQLDNWKPVEIAEDYEEFIEQYGLERKIFTFYRFVYYGESIRELAKQAIEAKGTILLSLERS